MSARKTPRVKKEPPPPTPKQAQPWDMPPYPKYGDGKDEITFVAIGRALTAWENFEIEMSDLFAKFLGVRSDPLPASRAYGSVLTFRGRADMVQAAADAYFFTTPEPTIAAEVSEVLKQARGFSARRNEIAHGIVRQIQVPSRVIFNPKGGGFQTMKNWGFAVVASDYATNKTKLAPGQTLLHGPQHKPTYTYTSVEIDFFARWFATIGATTTRAAHRVFNHSVRMI